MRHRIIIQEIDKPHRNYLRDDVKWICESLGLTTGRDTEDMSFKIMYDLLNQFQNQQIVPSEEVARSLEVDTPRVNHHLRNLMDTGIIIRQKRKVALRGGSLKAAIEEMRRDSDRMFSRLLEVAEDIDEEFEKQ